VNGTKAQYADGGFSLQRSVPLWDKKAGPYNGPRISCGDSAAHALTYVP
jgi:hypothetical protein